MLEYLKHEHELFEALLKVYTAHAECEYTESEWFDLLTCRAYYFLQKRNIDLEESKHLLVSMITVVLVLISCFSDSTVFEDEGENLRIWERYDLEQNHQINVAM